MDHRALQSEELNPGSTMVNGVPHSPNTFLDIRVQNGQLVRTLLQQIDYGHGRSRSRKNVELQQSSMDGPAPRANLPSDVAATVISHRDHGRGSGSAHFLDSE